MSLIWSILCLPFLLALTSSKPLSRAHTPRQESTLPPCGDVIAWVKNDYTYFEANFVYTCLRSVPFNPDVATRFLRYYNTTLQFHAPLDSLKAPPSGYQQPAIDIEQGLANIQSNVDAGNYTNQYQFEVAVHRLTAQMHDPHVQLNAGILAAFSFASPYGIISASVDGKELPGVYIDRDVINSQREGWEPSPIVKINGQNPVEYLMRYAEANAASYLEPHAEWNSLMESPVLDILGLWSAYQQGNIYPGEEDNAQLNVELKNGSKFEDTWSAVYQEGSDTGPLTTAGDFYNYFVLGQLPANWKTAGQWWPTRSLESADEPDSADPTVIDPVVSICSEGTENDQEQVTSWCESSSAAFPNDPVVIQEFLEVSYDEVVTGYILEDISTGVLSIPRFYTTDAGGDDSFRAAIQDFIDAALEKEVKRIVIDLQRNNGGSSFRAYDTFKLFFPQLEPYGASQTRKHELANILGTAYTSAFNETLDALAPIADGGLEDYYAASEWVVSNRVDAEKSTKFESWQEYFDTEGSYSRSQRYNLSDIAFNLAAFPAIPWGYDPEIEDQLSGQPFAADDIVILTDGLCGSSCSLFVEFMSHQGGVRTIAVGGRPETGPMQAVSGSRGAAAYSADAIDFDILQVNETLHDSEALAKLPDRGDTGMWVNYAGITIRNQIRENDATPLQFQFQAADCRIFYTLKSVYNMTQLWRDAAKATWDDASLCVEGSTGYLSARSRDSNKTAPIIQTQSITFDINPDPSYSVNSTFEIQNGPEFVTREQMTFPECSVVDTSKTLSSEKCLYMDVKCTPQSGSRYIVTVPITRPLCKWSGNGESSDSCQGVATCTKDQIRDTKTHTNGDINAEGWWGYCKTVDLKPKSTWCTDVAASTTTTGRVPSKAFKCDPITRSSRMTATRCKKRRRIYGAQTFAVWTKTGVSTTAGVDIGTCSAYTCKAPTTSELVASANSTLFKW